MLFWPKPETWKEFAGFCVAVLCIVLVAGPLLLAYGSKLSIIKSPVPPAAAKQK